ncbi:MAG TPA: hypothetical protein VMZ92_08075 [Planctomycetota bacterium]|nr:hypothetical protein [Planctomycetota bacterium]
MTATASTEKVSANRKQIMVAWKPADAATAQLVDLGQPQGASALMLPIKDYHHFTAQTLASLLVGAGVIAFSIYAGTSAAGATPTAVKTHAVGSAPDAQGDSLFLECSVQDIHEVLPAATHVGVWLDCANNDDETSITFTCERPRFPVAGLTADYIVA